MNDYHLELFLAKIRIAETGCWEWTAARSNGGYGYIHQNGVQLYAHRPAYEHWVGPIPEGLTIDHLCNNTCCVNPDHLQPKTLRENVLRGKCPGAINARKSLCKRGHVLSGANLYQKGENKRACRECARQANREWRNRNLEAQRERERLTQRRARALG